MGHVTELEDRATYETVTTIIESQVAPRQRVALSAVQVAAVTVRRARDGAEPIPQSSQFQSGRATSLPVHHTRLLPVLRCTAFPNRCRVWIL